MKPELLKRLVDQKYSLTKVLNRATGQYYGTGTCYCPFHDNTNTPAASIYNNDGEESLYCFAEQKTYRSSDALEILLNQNVYKIGEALWSKMTPAEQEEWKQHNITEDIAASFDIENQDNALTDTLNRAYNSFKYAKIDFKKLKEYMYTELFYKHSL